MARGYWTPDPCRPCPCCRSGSKSKFLCEECLHVCKAGYDQTPSCPAGHGVMRNMGQRWRPAKKGKRTLPPQRSLMDSPGQRLLRRITPVR